MIVSKRLCDINHEKRKALNVNIFYIKRDISHAILLVWIKNLHYLLYAEFKTMNRLAR